MLDVLSDWEGDAGLLSGAPAGSTIMGLRYHLSCAHTTTANSVVVHWGAIVVPEATGAAQVDPVVYRHLDWMDFGIQARSFPANTMQELVGRGDMGFRTVRSRRRLQNVEDRLYFVLKFGSGWTSGEYNLGISVPIALP
jgi:hypothetical protein